LEHFKKLQENLEFHQNKCHPGGVPDMRRQWVKAANQWALGVADHPTPLVEGNLTGWLRSDTLQDAVEGNLKLKVGGD
jgi:hypothetical protein